MSIINTTPQAPNSSQQIPTSTGHATECTPKPESEEQDWKTRYKNLKAEYDDLKTEYEMLQDKCNKMFSHEDSTMEDEDMFSVWLDNVESEI